MSATYRHITGLWLENPDTFGAARSDLDAMGLTRVRVWNGIGRGHSDRAAFSVKMPRHCGHAFRLLRVLHWVATERLRGDDPRHSPVRALAAKLAVGLGLPVLRPVTDDRERGILDRIGDDPAEVTGWLVYADWLDETGDPTNAARAALIRGWAARKPALRVKYGLPDPAPQLWHTAPCLVGLTFEGGYSWGQPKLSDPPSSPGRHAGDVQWVDGQAWYWSGNGWTLAVRQSDTAAPIVAGVPLIDMPEITDGD